MMHRWNSVIKWAYILLTVIPIVFLLFSTGSYWSVYSTFGDVPSTRVHLEVYQGDINVFLTEFGKVLIFTFFICTFIAMPVIMVANLVLATIKRENIFHRIPALTLFASMHWHYHYYLLNCAVGMWAMHSVEATNRKTEYRRTCSIYIRMAIKLICCICLVGGSIRGFCQDTHSKIDPRYT